MCSKHRDPREFVADPVVGYCWHCLEWHQHAMEVMAGAIPKGCQECDRSFADIARVSGDNVRMFLHPKDGVWQVLCPPCSDSYETKRRDLYGNTPHGKAKGLN